MVLHQQGSMESQQSLPVNRMDDGLVEWTVVGGVEVDQIEFSTEGGQGAQCGKNRALQDERLFPDSALAEILPNDGRGSGRLFHQHRLGSSPGERFDRDGPRPGAEVCDACPLDLCRQNIEDCLPKPVRRRPDRHSGQSFQPSTFIEARNDSHGCVEALNLLAVCLLTWVCDILLDGLDTSAKLIPRSGRAHFSAAASQGLDDSDLRWQ